MTDIRQHERSDEKIDYRADALERRIGRIRDRRWREARRRRLARIAAEVERLTSAHPPQPASKRHWGQSRRHPT